MKSQHAVVSVEFDLGLTPRMWIITFYNGDRIVRQVDGEALSYWSVEELASDLRNVVAQNYVFLQWWR